MTMTACAANGFGSHEPHFQALYVLLYFCFIWLLGRPLSPLSRVPNTTSTCLISREQKTLVNIGVLWDVANAVAKRFICNTLSLGLRWSLLHNLRITEHRITDKYHTHVAHLQKHNHSWYSTVIGYLFWSHTMSFSPSQFLSRILS